MNRQEEISTVTDRLKLLCSRREYSSRDIYTKALKALDGDAAGAETVLKVLQEEKYVDDMRYSCAYARDKSSISGWGKTKIRYMLSSKGVARDVIDSALLEIDEQKAGTRFEKLLLARLRTLKDDPQRRMKLLRYAAGRGYSYDDSVAMIDEILKDYESL